MEVQDGASETMRRMPDRFELCRMATVSSIAKRTEEPNEYQTESRPVCGIAYLI
jgi:hypothetical protein